MSVTTDNTQVYITGVLYQGDAFPDDATPLFNVVDDAFREIDTLEYQYLDINRSECRFSGGTTREQLLIFMKNVTYGGNSYLSDTESGNLRTAIVNALNGLSDVTYSDVEVRTTRDKNYTI